MWTESRRRATSSIKNLEASSDLPSGLLIGHEAIPLLSYGTTDQNGGSGIGAFVRVQIPVKRSVSALILVWVSVHY